MTRYEIHEDNMPRLEKKLATIQRKCTKYGCPFEYRNIGETFRKEKVNGTEITLRFIVIEVAGAVRVGDWRFIGTIEHDTPMNRIGQYAQDVELPKEYFTTRPICDHCNTNRARKDTYIIQSVENGEFKQVGRACMKDYTKGLSAEAAASWVSLHDSLIEGFEPSGMSNVFYYEVLDVLTTAISVVDTFGYVKTKNDYGDVNTDSTKNNVVDYLAKNKTFLKFVAEKEMVAPETNEDRAKEILTWALGQEEDYGYMTNLMSILRREHCEYKHIGLIVSAVASHRRAIEKIERVERAKRERLETQHVGEVGQRITFKVESLYCLTSYDTGWGTTCIYRITDANANIYIWKTGKFLPHEETIGSNITGTIKAHSEYNHEKQTELTRCKVKVA